MFNGEGMLLAVPERYAALGLVKLDCRVAAERVKKTPLSYGWVQGKRFEVS